MQWQKLGKSVLIPVSFSLVTPSLSLLRRSSTPSWRLLPMQRGVACRAKLLTGYSQEQHAQRSSCLLQAHSLYFVVRRRGTNAGKLAVPAASSVMGICSRDIGAEGYSVACSITYRRDRDRRCSTQKQHFTGKNRQFGLRLQLQMQTHSGSTALFPTRNYRQTARGHSSARLLFDVRKRPLLGYTHVADRAGLRPHNWC